MNRKALTVISRSVTAPLVAVALAACASDGNDTPEWMGTVSDSAGVTVVNNPVEGLWAEGDGWTVVEEVAVGGGLSGDLEYEFGQISGIDVDASGNLYVADIQAQEVRVFDNQGVYTHTIGQPGTGPGEIGLGLAGVFVINGEAHVADMTNARITRFELDGTHISGETLNVLAGIPIRWDRIGDAIVAQRRAVNAAQDPNFEPSGDVVVTMGATTDTLTTLPIGQSMQFAGGLPQVRIFEPEPIWDAGDDGAIIYGMNDAVRIRVMDPSGNLRFVVARPHEAKPVTERDQRVLKTLVGEQAAQQGAPPQMVQAILDQMQFAENFPAFATLAVGPNGSVWAQRVRSGSEIGEEEFNPQDIGSNEWDVYNSEGHYLGMVAFPGKYQPLKVIGDRFYGIHRDELDVQSVKVYRVVTENTDTQ